MKDGTVKPVITNRVTFETYTAPHAGEEQGRWPANLVLDEEAAAALDQQVGPQKSGGTPPRRPPTSAKTKNAYGDFTGEENPNGIGRSEGAVSRFFYCAKASRSDRGEGNNHPTVKNTRMMEWLVKLVTPPGGLCLDPFCGSGSTGRGCQIAGRRFLGIESNPDYCAIAERRLREAENETPLFSNP